MVAYQLKDYSIGGVVIGTKGIIYTQFTNSIKCTQCSELFLIS